MNGLVDHGIIEFLGATYGVPFAQRVVADVAHLEGQSADDVRDLGRKVLAEASGRLVKAPSEMFEDLGGWLTRIEAIRRLLRFSGRDFPDFLLSLEELPDRAHLVLPRLGLPRLVVARDGRGILVTLEPTDPDWQAVLIGLIRGMADDHGALCLISAEGAYIRVDIWDERFTEGRGFALGAPMPDQAPLP
ncbi:MAG: heme NO-binding protein [Paracoccus sp. (in: a-proteobacteria)]|nr:heme NO-binding protein [Paracoccus sp. (in: a-proteobacteria)]